MCLRQGCVIYLPEWTGFTECDLWEGHSVEIGKSEISLGWVVVVLYQLDGDGIGKHTHGRQHSYKPCRSAQHKVQLKVMQGNLYDSGTKFL